MDYWNLLLTEAQERFSENREVAAYMGTEILGMSIPTDTTPGHLGLPERVHGPWICNIDWPEYEVYNKPAIFQWVFD